ncbi:MAG TPA: flagellar basal body-associated FliL family protein [Desulfomicrobiaceae bacterium]|nr:flagellar basal body-associated FliL family protein [Desulfomicrobiaceae bacterium]
MADEKNEAKKSKKGLVMGLLALLLGAGLGVGGYFAWQVFNSAPSSSEAPGQATFSSEELTGSMVELDSFIVNILDEKGARYLKASITLDVDNEETVQEVIDRMPQIKDAVLLLVGNKSYNDLADLQGKLQLRVELISRLNEILKTGQVRKIYFTDFVVQ